MRRTRSTELPQINHTVRESRKANMIRRRATICSVASYKQAPHCERSALPAPRHATPLVILFSSYFGGPGVDNEDPDQIVGQTMLAKANNGAPLDLACLPRAASRTPGLQGLQDSRPPGPQVPSLAEPSSPIARLMLLGERFSG